MGALFSLRSAVYGKRDGCSRRSVTQRFEHQAIAKWLGFSAGEIAGPQTIGYLRMPFPFLDLR